MTQKEETIEISDIPPIRPGMTTADGFYQKFGVYHKKVRNCFKKCILDERKNTFFLASDIKQQNPLDLVQWIRTKRGGVCLALHEAPEAEKIFIQRFPEVKKALENIKKSKNLPAIRPGMWTSIDFLKKYGINPERTNTWFIILHKDQEKNTFFLPSDIEHKTPLELVQHVRSKAGNGRECLALHEKGLEVFKNWLKNFNGVELKERSSSRTLRPRLKAGADSSQRPKEPIRQSPTPQI